MIDLYKTIKGRKLRYGCTTGSCAAAAARAAVEKLFTGRDMEKAVITAPGGLEIELDIHGLTSKGETAECYVTKDAGDDPDCTNGIKIHARAKKINGTDIIVTGGEGIGIAGKKGLQVQQGSYAINPVPIKMITGEAKKALPADTGVLIEIFAPEGVELAKKTFNPKLGITGGISILGTTGIVEPISAEAMKESLSLKLSIIKEEGHDTAVLVPGNYGRKFAMDTLGINEDLIAGTGNYIGYMLDEAVNYGLKKILLVGHIGKLVKVAGGIFDTHSRSADGKFEILAANYIYVTGNAVNAKKIMESNTTEEALEYIDDISVYELLARKTALRCMDYARKALSAEAVIFSLSKGLLAMTDGAGKLIELAGAGHE